MYKLYIELDAQNDLRFMVESGGDNRRYAAAILALLSELKGDQALLGSLLDHKFENDSFNVSRFESIWRDRDVWRLKVFEWNLSQTRRNAIPYRIIYAYDFKCLSFRILAVVHRDFEYENDHPVTQRVLKAYSELGLPVIKTFHGKYKH